MYLILNIHAKLPFKDVDRRTIQIISNIYESNAKLPFNDVNRRTIQIISIKQG